MASYWIILLIPIFLTFTPFKASRDLSLLSYIFVGLIYVMFIGLRNEIGADWDNYASLFKQSKGASVFEIISSKDIGYFLLNWIFSNAGGSIYLVNTVCAIIFMLGLLAHCRNEPNPWLTLLVATPYLVFVVAMGLARQGVAIGFELLAIQAALKMNTRKYIAYILVAATFHKTALILLPLGLMATKSETTTSKNWQYALLAIIIISFPAALLYEQYVSLFEQYVVKGSESNGAYIRGGLNLLAATVIIGAQKRISQDKNREIVWRFFSFGAIACALATPLASTAADRLGLYFYPIQIYAIPRLILLFRKDIIHRTACALAISIYSSATMVVWLKYSQYSSAWIPYKTIFHEKYSQY